MINITWWVGSGQQNINLTQTSGQVRFATNAFNSGILVSQYANRQYATDAAGTSNNGALTPSQWNGNSSANINGNTNVPLVNIPNNWATFNVVVSSDAGAITCRNPEYRACQLNVGVPNINAGPNNVVVKVAEISHPATSVGAGGSGSASWTTITTGTYPNNMMGFNIPSPGSGGTAPNGTNTSGVRHDFFIIQSLSPTVTGIGNAFANVFLVDWY